MEGHHHQHQHQHQHRQQQQLHQQMMTVNVDPGDRFPQWSIQETKEFLVVRAELDQTFMETKRNKLLWEVIANKMKEKGYNRSPEQCKCKWKNLVTRYKGCETVEPEAVRQQFPFYNELQTIFAARMQRMLWAEAEGAATTSAGFKRKAALVSSDEEEDNEESEAEKAAVGTKKKKRLANKTTSSMGSGSSSNKSNINSMREILDDFMKQQIQMEMQWREAFEARENERMIKEREWRQTMEAIENERLMLERSWREREEQRRIREEARAEKRDALITTLLNRLRRDEM